MARPSLKWLVVLGLAVILLIAAINRSESTSSWSILFATKNFIEQPRDVEGSSVTRHDIAPRPNVNDNRQNQLLDQINDLKKHLRFMETAHQNRMTQMEKQFSQHVEKYHSKRPRIENEKDDSSTGISSKKSVQVTRPTLTRMARNGVEFMDNWRPVKFEFTAEQKQKIWDGFGSNELDATNCSIPHRKTIAVRFAAHGIGMNLIQLCNYIIYASYSDMKFSVTWISTYEYDKAQNELVRHPFQNWFEQHFSLVSKDSTCDIFSSVCSKLQGRCYDGHWENPSLDPRMDLWRTATSFMSTYQYSFNALHDAYKTVLMREILRLKPESRIELDKRHARAVQDAFKSVEAGEDEVIRIAVHVRRTDKITGEAKLVPATTFVKALRSIVDKQSNKSAYYLVHLISDDPAVHDEFMIALKEDSQLESRVNVSFRSSPGRPDRVESLDKLDDTSWYLLVDLRLMIESDIFLGSQSSNLGVTTCYLRVHHNCFSVEHPTFVWESRKNKVAR